MNNNKGELEKNNNIRKENKTSTSKNRRKRKEKEEELKRHQETLEMVAMINEENYKKASEIIKELKDKINPLDIEYYALFFKEIVKFNKIPKKEQEEIRKEYLYKRIHSELAKNDIILAASEIYDIIAKDENNNDSNEIVNHNKKSR